MPDRDNLKFRFMREPDDPIALRASIGGSVDAGGYYCVIRGDPDEVLAMLEVVMERARVALPTLPKLRGDDPT